MGSLLVYLMETTEIIFVFQGYRDLTLLSRDSMTTILTRTNQLIHEKWIKLLDIPRAQVLQEKQVIQNVSLKVSSRMPGIKLIYKDIF